MNRMFAFLFVQVCRALFFSVVKCVRTSIALQTQPKNGAVVAPGVTVDAVNGMQFPNDGTVELIVGNGSGGNRVVTVRSVACSHGRITDTALTIPALGTGLLGPFEPGLFNQPGTNMVNVDFDGATSTSIGAVQKQGLKS